MTVGRVAFASMAGKLSASFVASGTVDLGRVLVLGFETATIFGDILGEILTLGVALDA